MPDVRFVIDRYTKSIVIGCAQEEQLAPQEVVFDVEVTLPCMPQLLVDSWEPVFDYCVVTDCIDAACTAQGVKILQEPLAWDVVNRVFQAAPLVKHIKVFTQKTQRYQDTRAIGFVLELSRSEWQALQPQVQALVLQAAQSTTGAA